MISLTGPLLSKQGQAVETILCQASNAGQFRQALTGLFTTRCKNVRWIHTGVMRKYIYI